MNKCIGCGALLQSKDANALGYTKDINNCLCERCFRIKHYSDYKLINKDNESFITILKNIGKTKDLVILVVDLFNIPKNIELLNKYLANPILLVLTKRDLLPLSVYDNNLLEYFKKYHLNIVDSLIISSNKNYHFDELMTKIKQYKKSTKVYVVGYTNAGKSTMINKIIYNYTAQQPIITTSMLPSTTIDSIEIKIADDLTLIDTPGLLENNSMLDCVDIKMMKKIVPTKEIKPKTYQIKNKQSLFIEDLLRIDCQKNNSLTFYIANSLNIARSFKDTDKLSDLKKYHLKVEDDNDIVIAGLGFIKVVKSDTFDIYTLDNVDVYTRKSLI